MGRRTIAVSLLIVAAGAIASFYGISRANNKPAAEKERIVHAERRKIGAVVNATGVVRLRVGSEVRVGSQLSGIVKKLNVTVGSHVEEGEVIAELDDRVIDARIADLFPGQLTSKDYDISYRIYGRDAVMGRLEPKRNSVPAYEVGVLITITAPTQELANKIATFVSHVSAHLPVPEYHGIISSIAYPFSPPELPRGAVYRFSVNHVVAPDDPYEMFRTELVEV